jgi:hypothetical protein
MKRFLRAMAGPVSALCAAALLAGCSEDDLSGEEFRIEPASVVMDSDDTARSFTVIGGVEPLTWSVTDESLGVVSGGGRTVTYTRTSANGVNVVKVRDSRTWEASATVNQKDAVETLTLSPASASLTYDGDQVVFTASGGEPPYEWSVGMSARGYMTWRNTSTAVYTRSTSGDNTVIVVDSTGLAAIAEVTQPDA